MYRRELSRILSHAAGANKATAAATNVGPTSLDGYGNVALAKITAEGNLATSCVDDVEEGIRFLSDVRTGSGGLEEK